MKTRRAPMRHVLACYAALYGPSTPEKKREAERLAAEHCRRVERGVPRTPLPATGPQPELFAEGATGTSQRCPCSEKTLAGEAWCSGDASADGRGELPPGDSPIHSDAA